MSLSVFVRRAKATQQAAMLCYAMHKYVSAYERLPQVHTGSSRSIELGFKGTEPSIPSSLISRLGDWQNADMVILTVGGYTPLRPPIERMFKRNTCLIQ